MRDSKFNEQWVSRSSGNFDILVLIQHHLIRALNT